ELGDFYPSLAIAMMHTSAEDSDPTNLGDPNGLIGIHYQPTAANTRVTLEMTCSGGLKLFDRAVFSVTVPKAGEVYTIAPVMPYDQRKLASIRQVQPIYVTYRVTINGRKQPERTERLLIQSINVCPFGFTDEEDNYTSLDFMFAAYVNEDHPQIDRILQTALTKKYIDSFAGYQGETIDVYKQVLAVWRVLQERGIRYSNITTTVAERDNVSSQHVRLIDESLANTQANCVDGTVLFASILRKIGIEPILIVLPEHMFVGFDLDEDGEKQAYLETTMLGTPVDEIELKMTAFAKSLLADADTNADRAAMTRFLGAIQDGNAAYAKSRTAIEKERDGYTKLRVSEARQIGILPIMYVAKTLADK
ncbi:MAG: hypothetical protein LH609_02910, partial [Rudanella sp.]|nr:hypothetical protein [Rudanella sp.]